MTEPPDRVLVDPAAREAQSAFEAMMANFREMTPSERLAFGVASGLLHEDGTPRLPDGPPAISVESPLAQLPDALALALDSALNPVEASNMFDTFKLQVASLIERAAKMTGAERSLLGTIHQVLQGKDLVALDEATRTGLRVTARLLYITNPTEAEVEAACVALRQASGTHVHILESTPSELDTTQLVRQFKMLVSELFVRRAIEGRLPDTEEAKLADEQVELWDRIPQDRLPEIEDWIEQVKQAIPTSGATRNPVVASKDLPDFIRTYEDTVDPDE